jgi:hypothetical protein
MQQSLKRSALTQLQSEVNFSNAFAERTCGAISKLAALRGWT